MERSPVFLRSGHCQALPPRPGRSSRPGNFPESLACRGGGVAALRRRSSQEGDPTEEPPRPSTEAAPATVQIELRMDAYSAPPLIVGAVERRATRNPQKA